MNLEKLENQQQNSNEQSDDNNSGKDEVIKVGDDFCDALRYGVYTDSVIGGANE